MVGLTIFAIALGSFFLWLLVGNLKRHTEGIQLFEQGLNILNKHAHELTAEQLAYTVVTVTKLRVYKRFAIIDVIAIVVSLTVLLWNLYNLVRQLS